MCLAEDCSLVLCDMNATMVPTDSMSNATVAPTDAATEEDSGKVALCHKAGNSGKYVYIEVGAPAVDKHLRRHGDGFPGEPLPEDPTMCFTEECDVIVCPTEAPTEVNATEVPTDLNATFAPTEGDVNATLAPTEGEDDAKVYVCHKAGNSGKYVLINISINAVSVHLDHGDGFPGEEVPDMDGMCFDAVDCEIIMCPTEAPTDLNATMVPSLNDTMFNDTMFS